MNSYDELSFLCFPHDMYVPALSTHLHNKFQIPEPPEFIRHASNRSTCIFIITVFICTNNWPIKDRRQVRIPQHNLGRMERGSNFIQSNLIRTRVLCSHASVTSPLPLIGLNMKLLFISKFLPCHPWVFGLKLLKLRFDPHKVI